MEAGIVIFSIILAIILFVTEILSVDMVAVLIMSMLMLSGIITPEEGVAGFSNSATVTVAAMFVLSAALINTGIVNRLGVKMSDWMGANFWLGLFFLMLTIGVVSAFINNTPVVAVFIPVAAQIASSLHRPTSKFLIPVSFASIFGGSCCLIGTSTNILVSGMAEQQGFRAFSMFEMTPMGLVFFAVGMAYMLIWGVKLIPARNGQEDLQGRFDLRDYISEIILLESAPSVGLKIMDSPLVKELELEIIEIRRGEEKFILPPLDMVLLAQDHLKVRCNVEKIKALKDRIKVNVNPQWTLGDESVETGNTNLVEVVITANSEFEGKTLNELEFKRKYRAVPLAIRQRDEILHENLNDTILKTGDVLLVEVKSHRLEDLKKLEAKQGSPFIILSEELMQDYDPRRFALVISTLLVVIVTATFDIVPIMTGSIAGTAFLILTGCLTTRDAYQAIDWKVVFLLAGSLSLGVAMQKSGVALILAEGLVNSMQSFGLTAIVSGLYLITTLLTSFISNNASAALLTPIAIATAQDLEVSPLPFLMAITFAASASFMTPIGYQTNTMIYSAGQYKFMDFIRVGTPLNLLFWILATFLIPWFYPF